MWEPYYWGKYGQVVGKDSWKPGSIGWGASWKHTQPESGGGGSAGQRGWFWHVSSFHTSPVPTYPNPERMKGISRGWSSFSEMSGTLCTTETVALRHLQSTTTQHCPHHRKSPLSWAPQGFRVLETVPSKVAWNLKRAEAWWIHVQHPQHPSEHHGGGGEHPQVKTAGQIRAVRLW